MKTSKSIYIVVLIVTGLVSLSSFGAEVDRPMPPISHADLVTLEHRAKGGDPSAEDELGYLYGTGNGVKQNIKESYYWYSLAANQGNAEAQYNMGNFYYAGAPTGVIGKEVDIQKAAAWYAKSADQGYPKAQLSLALLYWHGKGVSRNPGLAFTLASAAAHKGNLRAQTLLGVFYSLGVGTLRDDAVAFKLTSDAAARGDSDAQLDLALLYYNGRGTAVNKAKAVQYTILSANQKNALAEDKLANLYFHGDGVPRDLSATVSWFFRAAADGRTDANDASADAKYSLGILYLNGIGLNKDEAEGARWITGSVIAGYAPAQELLGELYQIGRGVPQNQGKAMALYRAAARKDYGPAKISLAKLDPTIIVGKPCGGLTPCEKN
jgi:TPR repeat protein